MIRSPANVRDFFYAFPFHDLYHNKQNWRDRRAII